MLSTDFFNQSLNSTLIEALMVSTSNCEMKNSLFLGIDASFNLKFRIAIKFVAAEVGADQLPLCHEAIQILAGLCAGAMAEIDIDLLGQVRVVL